MNILDLSKEVLWVSVGQGTAKLQTVKVGCLEKILPLSQPSTSCGKPGFDTRMMGLSSKFKGPQLCRPKTC